MGINSSYVNDLPLASSPENLEVPGFDISTNRGAKITADTLKGAKGDAPTISISAHSIPNGQIPTVTQGGTISNPTYDFGIPLAADGTTPEIRNNGTNIQYRYGTGDWVNLVSLASITGPSGSNGTNGSDGKTPVMQAGTATGIPSGQNPTVQVTQTGTDPSGNPIYSISLGIPKGDTGNVGPSPRLDNGTIATGAPGSSVSLTFTYTGVSTNGQPIYRIDGSIPQGIPGSGSGNVVVTEQGLIGGNQYVFVPNGDNTAVGTFQPYISSSDWNNITNKPDFSTVATSGSYNDLSNKPNLDPYFVTGQSYSTTPTGVSESSQIRSINNGAGTPVVVQFPMVTNEQAGAMPASAFTQIQQNTSDIASIKAGGGKRWPSQPTKAALDSYGVPSGGSQNDVITVRTDETQGGATTQYVLIDSGSGLQWTFDYIIDQAPISIATETTLGIVKGSNIDGQQLVEADGTMSTVGWDDLKQRVTNVESNKQNKITAFDDSILVNQLPSNPNSRILYLIPE